MNKTTVIGNKTSKKTKLLLQKTKNKQARLSRRSRAAQSFWPHPGRHSGALFVDDIVTSGGTAKACYRALGQPAELTVWSLFYRKSL